MEILDRFRLDGRTALVTGGSRGIGLEIAEALAQAGAGVTLMARRPDFLEAALERVPEALSLTGDVSNVADLERAVEQAGDGDGIDILVNAAGITWGQPALEMPLEKIHQVLDVNLVGTLVASQIAGRGMKERGYGKIINISSISGQRGQPPEVLDVIGYTASKGGVDAVTRDLAVKWGRYGIRVNAIAPGFFPTRMTEKLLPHVEPYLQKNVPLGRAGKPGEVAGAALFLASPASDYVTGHLLVVDGGISA